MSAEQRQAVKIFELERWMRATVMLAPDLSAEQRQAVKIFELERWMPTLLSSRTRDVSGPSVRPTA